jgi:hypothetical protein
VSINIWCPVCGGVLRQTGWTDAGHRLGVCTEPHCAQPVTVTVTAHNVNGSINKAAPFYPLVMLIDGLEHTDPKGRWVTHTPSPRRSEISPTSTVSSTGSPQGGHPTIDVMENA